MQTAEQCSQMPQTVCTLFTFIAHTTRDLGATIQNEVAPDTEL